MKKRPIKITYIIDALDTNLAGTENQLIKLINGLDKKAFQVQLICFNSNPWFRANRDSLDCRSEVFEINQFNKFYTYRNLLKFVGFLRMNKPDVIHTFFPVANSLGVIAGKLAGIENIISSRRDYGEWMSGRYLIATKLANKFVKKILTNSNKVKAFTEKKENIKNGKVGVIYNGIDLNTFQKLEETNGLKRHLKIPDHHKVIGIVANFRPMKKHSTFIKAANELLKTRDDVSFLLIGEGPMKENIRNLASELGIQENVLFAGAQKEVLPYLSILDVGVNCSEMEGLSNAIMEYMAAGVPCVVSDAGGNPDLIQHEVNGFTFPLNDYQTLARLILKLLDGRETRTRFIKESKVRIQREMSLEVMLSKYESIYQKLVNA